MSQRENSGIKMKLIGKILITIWFYVAIFLCGLLFGLTLLDLEIPLSGRCAISAITAYAVAVSEISIRKTWKNKH